MHPARTHRLLSNGIREGWAERPRSPLILPGQTASAPHSESMPRRNSIIPVFHGPDAQIGSLSIAAAFLK